MCFKNLMSIVGRISKKKKKGLEVLSRMLLIMCFARGKGALGRFLTGKGLGEIFIHFWVLTLLIYQPYFKPMTPGEPVKAKPNPSAFLSREARDS